MTTLAYARETVAALRASGLHALLRDLPHLKGVPLEIDWGVYEAAEARGTLYCYSARLAHELAGCAAYVVGPHLHYKDSLQALQEVFFVLPQHASAELEFLAYCDRELGKLRVQATYAHSRTVMPMDPVLERLGYSPVDTVWMKQLSKGN